MDIRLIYRLASELFIPAVGTRYRFMNRRWWVIRDGLWVQAGARTSLEREILELVRKLPSGPEFNDVKWNVPKMHVMGQVLGHLTGWLMSTGLPAREEAPEL